MGEQVPTVSKRIEATNLVVWRDKSIRARIDPTLAVKDVIRQLSLSFDTDESHITLAIRDEADQLVTDDNLAEKIQNHEKLKLVPSPTLEALDIIAVLRHALNPNEQVTLPTPTGKAALTPLKMALFNLAKYINEEDFAIEFVMQNGIDMLDRLIEMEGLLVGNSLAYALNGVNAIMDLEHGWNTLSDGFITRLLVLTSNSSLASNIARPSTLILQKLVDADAKGRKGKQRELGEVNEGPRPICGFDKIYGLAVSKNIDLLPPVAERLEAGDLELLSASLTLVNALGAGALSTEDVRAKTVIQQLEVLHVRRNVARLIPSNIATVLTQPLSDFQHLYLRILQYRMQTRVEPWRQLAHEKMLAGIWKGAKLESHGSAQGRSRRGWLVLGLGWPDQEGGEGAMFDDVGELGLECLHYYVTHEDDMAGVVLEQAAKPEDRRCPIGAASSDCVKLLVEHYVRVEKQSTSSLRQHFLNFVKLHALVTRFFLRMWQESAAHTADYDRLVKLTGSHIRGALADEHKKSWLELELDFLETDYRTVRERQMVELEQEDDLMNGSGMNGLKQKLRSEAFDFITEQRINCMLQGGWFYSGALVRSNLTAARPAQQNKPWRFLRLLPSRAAIAYADYPAREAAPNTAALTEKVELDNVTTILPHTSANVTARQGVPSPNSFSIMADAKTSLLDVVCIHAEQYAEWVDGFKMLRNEMSESTKETANYVNILSDLALKVRWLDMSGEGVRAPGHIPFAGAPSSTDFYFASS